MPDVRPTGIAAISPTPPPHRSLLPRTPRRAIAPPAPARAFTPWGFAMSRLYQVLCSKLRRASVSAVLLLGLLPTSVPVLADQGSGCAPLQLTERYKSGVLRALESKTDLWGEEALARPEGPTYDNLKDYLTPLLLTRQARAFGPLTQTQVHYLPFGQPAGPEGRGPIALHVADGSQVLSDQALRTNVARRWMSAYVGAGGQELYGSCLSRLEDPRLAEGYLPILRTEYRDADGVRYVQESFATRLAETGTLASFVKLTARGDDTDRATARVRFALSDTGLAADGNRLVKDGQTYLAFSEGGTPDGAGVSYTLDLSDDRDRSVYVVRPISPAVSAPRLADAAGYASARSAVEAYWDARLSEGAQFSVPEDRVMDAQRNLLIQNLLMTWRYSVGNAYEAFYQPESSDTASTLGEYGFTDVYRTSLQTLLPLSKEGAKPLTPPRRRVWEQGEKLSHAAHYYQLTRDPSFIAQNLATYRAYFDDYVRQRAADPYGLVAPQDYSSDIKKSVHGLHHQTVAWRGLRDMLRVWDLTGRSDLVAQYRPFVQAFSDSLRAAISASETRLPDGALFVQAQILENEPPYDPLTGTTLGGYWNLVAPYGFGSGFFRPGGDEAAGILQYVNTYGGRLLGMTRARDSAANSVYGVQYAQFLADNDQADRLVLALYGKLAHGMTRNTFIAGESDNVGPIQTKWPDCRGLRGCVFPSPSTGWTPDEYYRASFNPPNTASNTMFLKTLRLMLLHETWDDAGTPAGLELAYATPRGWLEDGQVIRVKDAPTLFGPISYTIRSSLDRHQVEGEVVLPERDPIGRLSLRLRVPKGKRMAQVLLNGRGTRGFDPDTETIDLTGQTGTVRFRVLYRGLPRAPGDR